MSLNKAQGMTRGFVGLGVQTLMACFIRCDFPVPPHLSREPQRHKAPAPQNADFVARGCDSTSKINAAGRRVPGTHPVMKTLFPARM